MSRLLLGFLLAAGVAGLALGQEEFLPTEPPPAESALPVPNVPDAPAAASPSAVTPAPGPASAAPVFTPVVPQLADSAALARLLKNGMLIHLPKFHEEHDNWGKQVHIFDGLKWEREGLKIEVRKKEKLANHGLWKHYRVWIQDPERDLDVQVKNLVVVGPGHVTFQVAVRTKITGFADVQQHSNGLQLLSVKGEGDAVVAVIVDAAVKVGLQASGSFVPDLVVEPTVGQVDVQLQDFKLRRLGHHIKGNLANEIGNGLEGAMRRAIDKSEHKVKAEFNEQIAKLQDKGKLRVSAKDALSQGFSFGK